MGLRHPGSLFTDQSGNANHGSNEGTWSSVASGWLGQSADLDEAYAYASVGSPAAWTSAQWVNLDSLPPQDFSMLAANGNGTTDWTGWAVVVDTQGQVGAYVEGGSSSVETVLISTDTACVGGWTHVAATWDSGTLSVYVDGTLAATVVAPFSAITPGELPFIVGWDGNQQRRYVDGQLDDVALWGSALSAADIAAVAADGFCAIPL